MPYQSMRQSMFKHLHVFPEVKHWLLFYKSMGQLKLLESDLPFKTFCWHSVLRQETCLQTLGEFHQLLSPVFKVEFIFLQNFAVPYKSYTLALAVQVSRSPQATLRMSRFLSRDGSVSHAVDAFVRAVSHRAPAEWGGGRRGGGAVLRHCLTDSQGRRLSQRPGTTRSSSPSHRHTNNAVLQLRLWPHSHPLQIPPPSYLSSQPLLAAPTPQHGPGHRERWHAFLSQRPVQTRWVCSATASNKSEHIYDANRSVTPSFAALSTSEDWGRMSWWSLWGTLVLACEVLIIIVLSTAWRALHHGEFLELPKNVVQIRWKKWQAS